MVSEALAYSKRILWQIPLAHAICCCYIVGSAARGAADNERENMSKHLWEVKHSYYCNEGNYYNNECGFEFKSWQEFMDEMGDCDFDYNLLFRWDWDETNDDGEPTYNGDDNYRNGKLKLFWMHQRKGRYVYNIIEVCRADEAAVIEYLKPRWEYMRALWSPIAAAEAA